MVIGSDSSRAIDALVGLILIIGVMTLFIHLTTTDAEFSRYNQQWNGTSMFFEALEGRAAEMIEESGELIGKKDTTLLVIAPGRRPTREEEAAYRSFLNAGNTLIIADDFNSGNDLLQTLSSSIRFERGNLLSLEREFEVASAPIGYPAADDNLVSDLSKIVFNHPVALSGGTPLLNTTPLSWIDKDGNRLINRSEPLNRFTLAAEENLGEGRLIVIGDASLFINAMQGLPVCDNALFLERLTQRTTLVDQILSKTKTAEGPISTFLKVRKTPSLVVVVTAIILGGLAWSFNRRRR